MNRRILVATDQSTGSDEAVRWASDWARREAAELLLVSVEETGGDSAGHVAEPDARLTEVAHRLVGEQGRGIHIRAGDAAEGIVHFGKEGATFPALARHRIPVLCARPQHAVRSS